MPSFIDHLGNKITLKTKPQRIISLVPSQTELLFYLGVGERIIGVTKFCVHPSEQLKEVRKIGGTKKFNMKIIDELQPDLILGNKEENYQTGILELQEKYPVWVSDIVNIHDSIKMIGDVGDLINKKKEASDLINRINTGLVSVKKAVSGSVLYFIWQKPYMVAANNTFLHSIIEYLGFENLIGHLARYPQLDKSELETMSPDFVFLSSEPYPFNETHIKEFNTIFPNAKVMTVDGEMFSWYGNRLLFAIDYFKDELTPALNVGA